MRRDQNEKSGKLGAFLVGGGLGFMFGRRSGRKRSEAESKPVIADLNQEVAKSKAKLADREQELREVATEKLRKAAKEKIERRAEPLKPTPEVAEKPTKKRTPVAEVIRQAMEVSEPTTGREHVVNAPEVGVHEAIPQKKQEAILNKRTEQLSTQELLRHAEKLYISGVSIRTMYESNQIDRRGLEKIVEAGFSGKDIKEVFEDVELGLERQRERAREFRHDPSFGSSGPADDLPAKDSSSSQIPPLGSTLPNTPNAADLQPVGTVNPSANRSSDQPQSLESASPSNQKNSKKTAQITAAAVIGIIIALFLIRFLFGL
jgi:DNA segregation ATPase FtsK/SpoIIIE-like protein